MSTQNNIKEFAGMMKMLAINSGAEMTQDIVKAYYEALKDIPINDLRAAVKEVLLTWEYPRIPPMATIMKHVQGKAQIEDKSLAMANKIISHLSQHGSTKRPDLSGDRIAMELMTYRWPYQKWAAEVLESEIKWWIKEFCEAYRAYEKTDMPLYIEADESVKKLNEGIGNIE